MKQDCKNQKVRVESRPECWLLLKKHLGNDSGITDKEDYAVPLSKIH